MKLTTLLLATAAVLPATHVAADEHSGIALFAQTVNEHSIISEGYTNSADALAANSQSSPTATSTNRSTLSGPHPEIWVSDLNTALFNDADRDGYFAGFSITLDVDISRQSADVFANIYLSTDGASPQLFHTTNVFSVFEQESFDRYTVSMDLTDNISAGHYDLLIDVVNAYSSEIEDSVSYRTHSNLANLPLESQNHQLNQSFNDPYYGDPYYDPYYDNNVVTTFTISSSSGTSFTSSANSGSGFGVSASVTEFRGSAGWATLLVLAVARAFRAKRR